jgi:hypothetical protein
MVTRNSSAPNRARWQITMQHAPKTFFLLGLVGLMITGPGCRTASRQDAFSHWPEGASPQEVGKRVAENFVVRKLDFETNPRRQYVIYPEICGWYGSLTVAKLIDDKDLQSRLIKNFDTLVLNSKTNRISPDAHVDYRVFGTLPLEIYLQTKDPRYLAIGKDLADKQWENPTEDGVTG